MLKRWLISLLLLPLLIACRNNAREDARAQVPSSTLQTPGPSVEDTVSLPETNFFELRVSGVEGRMVIQLYDETPIHRDNFEKLVAQGFYDGTTFHRIIYGFMIQGGDPNSRDEDPMNDGGGGPGYTVPAEFHPARYHKRGAVAAARRGDHVNPERASSGSQFYIVHGVPLDSLTLAAYEQQVQMATGNPSFHFSEEMRAVYRSEGGAPFLDQQYTVFGEVVEGFELLDRLASVDTPRRLEQPASEALMDRPLKDLPMTIRPLPDYEITPTTEQNL